MHEKYFASKSHQKDAAFPALKQAPEQKNWLRDSKISIIKDIELGKGSHKEPYDLFVGIIEANALDAAVFRFLYSRVFSHSGLTVRANWRAG